MEDKSTQADKSSKKRKRLIEVPDTDGLSKGRPGLRPRKRKRAEQTPEDTLDVWSIWSYLAGPYEFQETNNMAKCPGVLCEDDIPEKPSERLTRLLGLLKKQMNRARPSQTEISRLELQICLEIKINVQHTEALALARKENWPTKIDFSLLTGRVKALQSTLYGVLLHDLELTKTEVWKAFSKRVEDLVSFVKTPNIQAMHLRDARPG